MTIIPRCNRPMWYYPKRSFQRPLPLRPIRIVPLKNRRMVGGAATVSQLDGIKTAGEILGTFVFIKSALDWLLYRNIRKAHEKEQDTPPDK